MSDRITIEQFNASPGVDDWRVLSEGACALFRAGALSDSARFVDAIGRLEGIDAHHPAIDIRAEGVTVRLLTKGDEGWGMSETDVDFARRISELAHEQGLVADPSAVQTFLIVPGAPIPAEVFPFWRAALGYEPRNDSPDEDLVDPHEFGPGFWFEAMEEPRGDGGGAIHVAVWIPPEMAEARVAAALAAGGRMVRDEFAPSWWTLADAAGNEVDISTTTGRD